MKVGPREEEMRKWIDGVCLLSIPFASRKRCDIGFLVGGNSKFSIKNNVRGDSVEN